MVGQVCTAIWDIMKAELLPELTLEMWLNIAENFKQRANFPYVIGAIDRKHIRVNKPSHTGLCISITNIIFLYYYWEYVTLITNLFTLILVRMANVAIVVFLKSQYFTRNLWKIL
jgi:hypothetical protein